MNIYAVCTISEEDDGDFVVSLCDTEEAAKNEIALIKSRFEKVGLGVPYTYYIREITVGSGAFWNYTDYRPED